MIPELDSRGLLPAGVHPCTITEIEAVFGTNVRRQQLLESLRFCIEMMRDARLKGELIVNGSFVTDKPNPGDVEVCLDVRREADLIQGSALLFHVKNRPRLDRKGVDWYPVLHESEDGLERDFTRYFQYIGEKSGALKKLDSRDLKGILKLMTW